MACNCDSKQGKLFYSCSGSANTGYLADRVWRVLKSDASGAGSCLAGLGASLGSFIDSATNAGENIVIDGCAVSCGKKIFEQQKLPCTQVLLTDFGVEKGKTEITEELILRVATKVKESLR